MISIKISVDGCADKNENDAQICTGINLLLLDVVQDK